MFTFFREMNLNGLLFITFKLLNEILLYPPNYCTYCIIQYITHSPAILFLPLVNALGGGSVSSPADQDVLNRAYVIMSVSRLSHAFVIEAWLNVLLKEKVLTFFKDKCKAIFNLISTLSLEINECYSWSVCHLLNCLGSRQFLNGDFARLFHIICSFSLLAVGLDERWQRKWLL